MRTKILGRTGIEVSIVGLGAATLGIPTLDLLSTEYGPENTWKPCMDLGLGVSTVITALEAGVTLIDTAPRYGKGMSEKIIRTAFSMIRPDLGDKCTVTTKVGYDIDGGELRYDASYDAVMRSVEGSQRRLGQDHFRIVYLHDPMGQDMEFVLNNPGGALAALRTLQKQGVVDFIGVAANDPETNADYIETGEFDAAVVPNAWTLINQKAAKRILPAAVKHNVGLVVASSIERGLLTKAPIRDSYFAREFPKECLDQVRKMKELCGRYGISLTMAALQWCARHSHVATVIPGARLPGEAWTNTAAGDCEISEEFWEEFEPLVRHWDYKGC